LQIELKQLSDIGNTEGILMYFFEVNDLVLQSLAIMRVLTQRCLIVFQI